MVIKRKLLYLLLMIELKVTAIPQPPFLHP
uniref:Uncharacterized protein n=1 Tax=Siphoviridae sp. ctvuW5 TaxID=2825725 RepID=A0A8S5TXC3_9CAUD|nr:MAG TPA: hypothetical protein [Siphoviridae sp. ctvuW5]